MSDPISAPWPLTPLAAAPSVRVAADMPPLSPETERQVQECWDQALADHPNLYNGRVFCADEIQTDQITGHWSEFRRVLAQMRRPGLFGDRPLRPLAVVGLLRTADGVVIGQRAADAIYLPGWWQGAPAGNVESRNGEPDIDLKAQLLAEAMEELGLERDEITIGDCLLACEHPHSHIVDLGLTISTALSFAALRDRCATHGNAEYAALRLLKPGETPPSPLVPTLKAMLEHAL